MLRTSASTLCRRAEPAAALSGELRVKIFARYLAFNNADNSAQKDPRMDIMNQCLNDSKRREDMLIEALDKARSDRIMDLKASKVREDKLAEALEKAKSERIMDLKSSKVREDKLAEALEKAKSERIMELKEDLKDSRSREAKLTEAVVTVSSKTQDHMMELVQESKVTEKRLMDAMEKAMNGREEELECMKSIAKNTEHPKELLDSLVFAQTGRRLPEKQKGNGVKRTLTTAALVGATIGDEGELPFSEEGKERVEDSFRDTQSIELLETMYCD